MNPTKHDDDNETPPKVKAKACLGKLLIKSDEQFPTFIKTEKPFCLGIPLSREVSHSKFQEEYSYESYLWSCGGYSLYLDQPWKETWGNKKLTWKPPICHGHKLLMFTFGAGHMAQTRANALNKGGCS